MTGRARTIVGIAALAALIATVVTAYFWMSDDSPDEHNPTRRLALSTSNWVIGDPQLQLRVSGAVTLAESGCVHLVSPSGHAVDLVWPAGFTASLTDEVLEIRDADGEVVAKGGATITAAGGSFEAGDSVEKLLMPRIVCRVTQDVEPVLVLTDSLR